MTRHDAVTVAHPWRRVLRTVLAALPGLVVAVPLIVEALNIDPDRYPAVAGILAGVLAVTATLTRVLAVPAVETYLRHSIGWLAANDVPSEEAVPTGSVAAQLVDGKFVAGPAATQPDGTPVTVEGA